MNEKFLDKLGLIADILQVLNYIENTKQAQQLEEIYQFVNEVHNDIEDFRLRHELTLQKLDLVIDTLSKIKSKLDID